MLIAPLSVRVVGIVEIRELHLFIIKIHNVANEIDRLRNFAIYQRDL